MTEQETNLVSPFDAMAKALSTFRKRTESVIYSDLKPLVVKILDYIFPTGGRVSSSAA